jgi:hypothetical protein
MNGVSFSFVAPLPLAVQFDTRKTPMITSVGGIFNYVGTFNLQLSMSIDYRVLVDYYTCASLVGNALVNASGTLQINDTTNGLLTVSVSGGYNLCSYSTTAPKFSLAGTVNTPYVVQGVSLKSINVSFSSYALTGIFLIPSHESF